MLRALTVFGVLVGAVLGFGWFARTVLHIDCMGPTIEGWGCLATAYPAVLPGNSAQLYDLGLVVLAFIVSFIVKDLAWSAAGFVAGHLFSRWAHRQTVEASPTQTQRGYRIR